MPDYRELYIKLFRSLTEAINTLVEAQQETENIYIESEPTELSVFPKKAPENNEARIQFKSHHEKRM